MQATGPTRPATGLPSSSELEYRLLLEKLPAAAYTCDCQGLITYFNQRAVQLWGRVPRLNDPVDRFCGSVRLFAADGSPIEHDQCWMARTLHENREYNGHEILVERPDGSRLTVLAHANPIHDERGEITGAVNVLVDITDRKRAEEAVLDAGRRKDEFLAILAHELRNPLAPISNALQILRLDGGNDTTRNEARTIIERQLRQIVRLVDDLMDVSRITRNRLTLRIERVELAAAVRSAVESSRPQIEASGLQLVVKLPPEPIYLQADLTRLSQVFANLLNNAAKFTEPGGRIWLIGAQDGHEVVVTVRDTGIGISAEMLGRIFEPFTQIDHSLERSHGGLGIGLSLARSMVEMHSGSIEAHSDGLGHGSEFVVHLPSQPPAERANSRLLGDRGGTRLSSRYRILAVDDNQDSASSLRAMLTLMGQDVRVAHDGMEAVEVAATFHPDVVLLDIGLPKLNGYDAARRIRAQPGGKAVFLVAVTGLGQDEDKRRSSEAGFNLHIVKPLDPAALENLLAGLMIRNDAASGQRNFDH